MSELLGNSIESSLKPVLYGVGRELHVVEHEEFGFRSEIDGVADAHRLDHGFGFFGDAARVAVIRLAGGRLEHVADENERGLRKEKRAILRGEEFCNCLNEAVF